MSLRLAHPQELLGRQYKKLRAWLEESSGGLCVVAGPHGCGKTTLVRTALRELDPNGPQPAEVACFPALSAGEVLIELSHYLLESGDRTLHRALLESSSFALCLEIAKERLSSQRRALWLDDAECIGAGLFKHFESFVKESEALLEMLIAAGKAGAQVVITTTDPKFLKQAAGRLIEIPPLGKTELELLRSRAALPTPVGESRGLTPFWAVLASKVSRKIPGWRDAVPAETDLLILKLWEALSEECRAVASALALAGGPPTTGLLRYLERRGIATVEHFHELIAFGLMSEEGENRLALHPAAADVLQQTPESERMAYVIADYWYQRGRRTRSIWDQVRACELYRRLRAWKRLGEAAGETLEELIARGYLDAAEDFIKELLDTTEGRSRAVALGNLAMIRKNQGRYKEAIELYRRAESSFSTLGDTANLARVFHQLGNTYYLQGELERALSYYDRSCRAAETCGDRSVEAASRIQGANVLFLQGELDRAETVYEEGLRKAREVGDQRLCLAVALHLGQVQYGRGAYLEAEETLSEAVWRAERLQDGISLAKARLFLGLVARARGDLERAGRLFAQAEEQASRLQEAVVAGTAAFHRGNALFEQGDAAGALRALARSIRVLEGAERNKEARAPWALVRAIADRIGVENFRKLARQAGLRELLDLPDDQIDDTI